MVTRKIDSQGRVVIPVEWRRKVLKGDTVIVLQFDERIEIYPVGADLSEFIDAVEVELSEEDFLDYHTLRKKLREGSHALS
ncbi:MAG: AbrB/MazE/SpoVT family DNA-binding domain-containing protein [Candidatus Korarchaeota archaeon]|nr:AbrB/MazE/SpoVT family DNA-binding domain-containing protein [Candidatus Korarchaeota archaeon]NIU82186.1 AbrB family transcriptional regulator [Candidatus Thorarchaeota archaeon]NIW12654.1 AbrB family transcriptional regulator [Candidatus Thorarchaeota archaeon]NIW50861.1 AbrB family transcriptional regulator [Candidatus Korarchaeota archaeon]